MNIDKLLDWWQRGVIAALGISILLLGIGRLEFSSFSLSAWSVSRTTLVFWFLGKLLLVYYRGWAGFELRRLSGLAPLSLFFLAATLSLLPDFRAAGDYRYFAFACGHAVVVVDLLVDKKRAHWTLLALGVLPAILVVRGLVNDPALLSINLAHRFSFPLDHANSAGFVLALTLPLTLWCIATETGWWRRLAVVSCLLQWLALILTFSRAAWLGATLSLLAYAILLKQWKPITVIVATMFAALLALPTLRDRFLSMANPRHDVAISERLMLVSEGMRLGIDKPILGVGYGRGRVKEALHGRLRGTEYENNPLWHTHNLYVELFAGTGLLGLGAFLWVASAALMRAARSARQAARPDALLSTALASSWVAMLICGLGDVPFFHHETRIMLFTLLGLIVSACSVDTSRQ